MINHLSDGLPNPEIPAVAAETFARFDEHLNDHAVEIGEARAAGVPERQIEALYPFDWTRYDATLRALLSTKEARDRLREITATIRPERKAISQSVGGHLRERVDAGLMLTGADQLEVGDAAWRLAWDLTLEGAGGQEELDALTRACTLTYATLQALRRIAAGERSNHLLLVTFNTLGLATWHDGYVLTLLHLIDELQPGRAAASPERTLAGLPLTLPDPDQPIPFAASLRVEIKRKPTERGDARTPAKTVPNKVALPRRAQQW